MLNLDHFERLGLPRRFALDPDEVERQYLARSRALHPDFHQQGSEAEQNASLELTARLNEAYTTLKDPFKRAEYLLTREGGPSAGELKEMPAEFLEEVLQLRMAIAELEEDADRWAMEQRLKTRKALMLAEVQEEFARIESGGADRAATLRSIRARLNALKYIQNLLRDL